MPRRLAPVLVAAIACVLFALSADQALANHVECGDTVTQDTTLDSDLIDCPGDGIVIGAPYLTLDLNGHTIDGVGESSLICNSGIQNGKFDLCGPEISGHDGVTIRNGVIRDFFWGIIVFRAEGNRIERTLTTRSGRGILMLGSDSQVEDNVAAGNDAGIALGVNNRVEDNSVVGNRLGMSLLGDGNRLRRNSISDNTDTGLSVFTAANRIRENRVTGSGIGMLIGYSNNRVSGNWVSENDRGILLNGSEADGNLITRNSVSANASGIVMEFGADNNRIESNSTRGNQSEGIAIRLGFGSNGPSDGNVLLRNAAVGNGTDGILVAATNADTLVKGNIADRNGDDGIDVEDSRTTVSHNTANGNGDLGIEAVPGVTDGGGNRARGNGNPAQCTYVACN
jgi:parallel beta-helix repeat protein